MNFWDTSALLPLFVEEETTALLRKIRLDLADEEIAISTLTPVEFFSALSRLYRERRASYEVFNEAFSRFQEQAQICQVVRNMEVMKEKALRILRVHSLKAADALQLAAAFIACSDFTQPTTLVTLDKKLADAALKEGFKVLPKPNLT